MKKFTLMLLGLSFALISHAQTFFDKGVTGVTLRAGAQENYWANGLFGGASFTYKGAFDIGIVYGNYKYDKDHLEEGGIAFDETLKRTDVLASAEYWLLRTDPGKDRGVNVGFWVEYGLYSYSDSKFTVDNKTFVCTDNTGSGISLGLDFSVDFKIKDGWRLQPFMWIGEDWEKEKYKLDGVSKNEDYSGSCTGLGVVLQKMFKNGSSVFFLTEMDVTNLESEMESVFVGSIGYNFAFRK